MGCAGHGPACRGSCVRRGGWQPGTPTDVQLTHGQTTPRHDPQQPLLEWLANNYKKFGCALEFVTNRSQEGSQFCKGFGGIGGVLRYAVRPSGRGVLREAWAADRRRLEAAKPMEPVGTLPPSARPTLAGEHGGI